MAGIVVAPVIFTEPRDPRAPTQLSSPTITAPALSTRAGIFQLGTDIGQPDNKIRGPLNPLPGTGLLLRFSSSSQSKLIFSVKRTGSS